MLPVIVVTGMAFEARIARGNGNGTVHENIKVVYAARADKLAQQLDDALARGASGIISFGTAGGLAPDLAPGTVIIANAMDGPHGRIATDAGWSARLAGALAASPVAMHVRRGSEAAVTAPVINAYAKAALFRATGALAVDMESHVAANAANAHSLPFSVCRVIVDPASRSLPAAALAGLRDDGTTSAWPVLGELVRHPGQLRALLQVAADARLARATLVKAWQALKQAGALMPTQ